MTALLVAGDAHPALAQHVARLVGSHPAPATITRFEDGETRVRLEAGVQGADVYLLQPTCAPANEHLVSLALLADAARGAGAARITAVVPYFGYARQDAGAPGEPRSARLAARFLAMAGVDRLVVLEPHSAAIANAFDGAYVELRADEALVPAVREQGLREAIIVSPDAGGMKRAQRYAAALGAPLVMIAKHRPEADVAVAFQVLGDVAGRACLIVDDMASTGRTVAAAAQALSQAGCREVHALFVHAAMTAYAVERMSQASVRSFITTDSVPSVSDARVRVVSVAPLLARAIGALSL